MCFLFMKLCTELLKIFVGNSVLYKTFEANGIISVKFEKYYWKPFRLHL